MKAKAHALDISPKIKTQVLNKFRTQTSDTDVNILGNIANFLKYKEGLPIDKRDILKYDYSELVELVISKNPINTLKGLYNIFKKKEPQLENNSLKRHLKKYLEVQSELPGNKQDISNSNYLEVVKIIDDLYVRLITAKMTHKFRISNPELTSGQIEHYINSYIRSFDQIGFEVPGIDKLTFHDLELVLDSINTLDGDESKKLDLSDIVLAYDENNLKVYAPITKDQAIKLRNGRSWCTSREGHGNMYYNYRLENERTLYYVIDEDKPFADLNFAVVILVEPGGAMSLSDGNNGGRYSGHQNLPWSEIEEKLPKLKGLKNVFKPNPLTSAEKALIKTVKNVSPGDSPINHFGTEEKVELWLEINSPSLKDVQYISLSPELKKKYISLGMDLTTGMINGSEPEVIRYYSLKKIEKLKTATLSSLSQEDVALLQTPGMAKLKEELREKLSSELVTQGETVDIKYPSSNEGKFVVLYGMDKLFESIPDSLMHFLFVNNSESKVELVFPADIGRFKNVESAMFKNCITELPESIGEWKKLGMLSVQDNPGLKKLPDSFEHLPRLSLVNLGQTTFDPPKWFKDRFTLECKDEKLWASKPPKN